jgi:hypothetical protein
MVKPSPRRCLIRCFWNSVKFGSTADKITINSDYKSQFYFNFILTINEQDGAPVHKDLYFVGTYYINSYYMFMLRMWLQKTTNRRIVKNNLLTIL